MTDQATRVVPAGWYEDPSDAAQVRWWNGIAWTDHTQPKPELAAASEPAAAVPAAATARPRVRSTSTNESWIVAFSPAILAVFGLVGLWASLYVLPGLLFPLLALVLVYAVSTLFAMRDRTKLVRWGHQAPAGVSTFLTAPVYLGIRALRLKSWGQLIAWGLLMAGLVVAPVAAWFGGALPSVQTAVRIQTEIRAELVDAGKASSVACPPIADTMTVGSLYTCDVTLPDGSARTLVVSIDSDAGDYSYAFSKRN